MTFLRHDSLTKSEMAVASAGPLQTIHTSHQTDNHTNTSSLNFYSRMLFLTRNQQCQSTEGQKQSWIIAPKSLSISSGVNSLVNLYSKQQQRPSSGHWHATPCARSFGTAKIWWNSLPPSLRTCTSPDTFRRHLKTHYCQQAFHST